MKRISFKVAKAIKEAGYPQHSLNEVASLAYDDDGEIWEMGYFDQNPYLEYYSIYTYLDIWLWLWREKEIYIKIEKTYCVIWFDYKNELKFFAVKKSPEEAIIAAIEHLVDNDLIK